MAGLMTFVVSAIWHGFYPGYYVFFIAAGLLDIVYKQASHCYVLFSFLPDFSFKILA